jgi:hypothetical protein
MLDTDQAARTAAPSGKGNRQGGRRHAGAQRRADARADRRGDPDDWVDEILLVDDASSDGTVELARMLPVHVVWHPHNVGYGGQPEDLLPAGAATQRGPSS